MKVDISYSRPTWWQRTLYRIKQWWIWNIKLRRKIPFPAIRNLAFGLSIDNLVSTNPLRKKR